MRSIAIFSEQPTVATAGVQSYLSSLDDIESCILLSDEQELTNLLKAGQIQVLFVLLREPADTQYALIKNIKGQFPRIRMIALAPRACKEMIFQSVKSGANGFISADTTLKELREALYTVRAGHDYFSSSITR